MGAPRKHNIDVENLYVKLDKRNNKVYWQYKDPLSRSWQSFGTDEAAARAAAIELNRLFSEQLIEQSFALINLAKQKQDPHTAIVIRLKEWVEKYIELLEKRHAKGKLSKSSVDERRFAANLLDSRIGNTPLASVGSREMAAILEEYIDEGKNSMAKHVRSSWVDLFKEAQFAGEVPPGFNPALSTRKPEISVTRARLQVEDWKRILGVASQTHNPWAANALRLALLTGQRLSDLLKIQFKDIKDGYLHVEQGKTGNRVAIPTALRCDAIGMTLDEAISLCRDKVLSPWLIHHTVRTGKAIPGAQINKATASKMFKDCRALAGIITPKDKTPCSFHEQRSLAERLYHDQGINTQALLGHKTAEMTEMYHDERDNRWTYIAI
jgi:integrase